jgi:curved DNA-binding protein CbpA
MSDETYYTILGISETATQDEIDRAYWEFIEAYHVLSDPPRRSSYNRQLAERRRQRAPAPLAPSKAAPTPFLFSVDDFPKRIGCSVDEAKGLLAGSLPITPALARKLQSELGASVEFWMSQPFEEDSINPFAVMAIIVFFIGLGYAAFLVVAQVL